MFLVLGAVTACGDDGGSPDAGPSVDAAPDAPELPAGCDYAELNDSTNDTITVMTGVPEASGVAFSTMTTLCGKLNSSHFADNIVDVDTFTFQVPADAFATVTLTGAGLEGLGAVQMFVENADEDPFGFGVFAADHAITRSALPMGTYRVTVLAANMAAATADLDYKITVAVDDPTARCVKGATATTTFAETRDANNNMHAANDMLDVRFLTMPARMATASTTDMPEATGVTAAAGMTYRFTGSSANVNAADEYMDRDTYLFATGAAVNRMSVRLNWTGPMVDFDMLLLNAGASREISSGVIARNGEDEFITFAVKPNSMYWLWVGSYDGSVGLPLAYEATLCAETVTP